MKPSYIFHAKNIYLVAASCGLILASQYETVSGFLSSSSSPSPWGTSYSKSKRLSSSPVRLSLFSATQSSTSSNDFTTPLEAKKPPRRERVMALSKRLFNRLLSQNHRIVRETHAKQQQAQQQQQQQPSSIHRINSMSELDDYFDDTAHRFRTKRGDIDSAALLDALHVSGDTQIIGSADHPEYTHPVAQLLHQRQQNRTAADGAKIALAVEGGGMRGCVSAGMVSAIHYLNLTDSFDVVYGSSAGTVIAAYLIAGQVPWFGPELYYDSLTTAGKEFIDSSRLLRALGFGLADPRLFKDVVMRPDHGKPVLNLPFLLKTTMQHTKKLDWKTFVERQKKLPLKVVVSGLKSEKSLVFDHASGHFENLSELTDIIHASCLLPGIAGPVMNMDRRAFTAANKGLKKYVLGNNLQGDHYEPMADALVYEPLPFRSAVDEGATHVVMIRSRPDGADVTGKVSFFENLIFKRFFLRKNRLPRIFDRMVQRVHKKIYAQDVIRLNQEAYSTRSPTDHTTLSSSSSSPQQQQQPHLLTIAEPPGSPEVTRLETSREAILQGIRRGFARAYDCLVADPSERGRGAIVARELYPDEILAYDPLHIQVQDETESAFAAYLRTKNDSNNHYSKQEVAAATQMR